MFPYIIRGHYYTALSTLLDACMHNDKYHVSLSLYLSLYTYIYIYIYNNKLTIFIILLTIHILIFIMIALTTIIVTISFCSAKSEHNEAFRSFDRTPLILAHRPSAQWLPFVTLNRKTRFGQPGLGIPTSSTLHQF